MLLNIYKPSGPTSHDMVDKVRRITGKRKVGHGGTLDPFAEGVLIIGVGKESTRKLGNVSKDTEKEYVATLELNKTSSTGDIEGEITKIEAREPSKGEIVEVLNLFKGEITQIPSKYSAIKIKGKPAYKYAREGKEVKIPERKVYIYEIELLEYDFPFLKIKVLCSSGTYIRTLAEDIGKKLNSGAYLTELVRTKVGNYKIEDSIKVEEISIN